MLHGSHPQKLHEAPKGARRLKVVTLPSAYAPALLHRHVMRTFNLLTMSLEISIRCVADCRSTSRTRRIARSLENAAGAVRAAELTHQLLAYSRRQPLRPHPVTLATLLAGLDDLLSRTLGVSIRVSIEVAPDTWPVMVDPSQLEAALILESKEGQGTKVRSYLPRHDGVAEAAAKRPSAVAATGARGRRTVLLVEDETDLREWARIVLEELATK